MVPSLSPQSQAREGPLAPEHGYQGRSCQEARAPSEAAPLKQSLVPCPCHHWFQAEPGWQEFPEVLREDRGDAEERQKPH